METYENDYKREEDEVLWELHEIRRRLRSDFKNKPVEQINKESLEKFSAWQNQAKKSQH
jgi:hypothetical protein